MRTLLVVIAVAGTPATPAAASAGAFRSPSGNIGCFIDATGARCDIARRDWSPPPKPASCSLDFGQGITIAGGRAHFVCAGDTTLGATRVLAYGHTIPAGRYACASARS